MSSAEPLTVGVMLRTARESAGLSVADIAERTRVRATLIREIEADDFAGCGASFYARGHVRSIATTVGLDPGPVLSQFDVQHGSQAPAMLTDRPLPAYEPSWSHAGPLTPLYSAPPASAPLATAAAAQVHDQPPHWVKTREVPLPKVKARKARSAKRFGPNWTSAMIVAAALVALFAIGTFIGLPHTTAKVPAEAIDLGTPVPTATPAPKRSGPVAQVPQTGVNLRIRVTNGASWVRVTDGNGREMFQGVLDSGTVKDFHDSKALIVRYGNAPAVIVILNGHDRGSPSCPASVCSVRYEPDQAAG